VRRDEKLALVVETEAPTTAASRAVELPSGTVRMSTEKVVLGNPAGVETLLEGVGKYSRTPAPPASRVSRPESPIWPIA
jgi:hypothetical protein